MVGANVTLRSIFRISCDALSEIKEQKSYETRETYYRIRVLHYSCFVSDNKFIPFLTIDFDTRR